MSLFDSLKSARSNTDARDASAEARAALENATVKDMKAVAAELGLTVYGSKATIQRQLEQGVTGARSKHEAILGQQYKRD
jgi:hypothetical protein